nr:DNA translocase FtsK [Raoultella sp. NCTC 9187]
MALSCFSAHRGKSVLARRSLIKIMTMSRSPMKKLTSWSRASWRVSLPPPSSSATVRSTRLTTAEMTIQPPKPSWARQFAATQQQRYSSEQPRGANPFSPADYDFFADENAGGRRPERAAVYADAGGSAVGTAIPAAGAASASAGTAAAAPCSTISSRRRSLLTSSLRLSSRYNLRQRRRATSRSRPLRPRCSRRSNSRRRSRRRA